MSERLNFTTCGRQGAIESEFLAIPAPSVSHMQTVLFCIVPSSTRLTYKPPKPPSGPDIQRHRSSVGSVGSTQRTILKLVQASLNRT